MTYTVHFQRGSQVGARSLRFVRVEADNEKEAVAKARRTNVELRQQGYRIVRVDTLDN